MAEKNKEHESKEKKAKKKLHKIITTKAEDGSFGHEHVYHGEDRPVFAGTSQKMEDLHSHMDDHFGGGGAPAGDGQEAPPEGAEAPGE